MNRQRYHFFKYPGIMVLLFLCSHVFSQQTMPSSIIDLFRNYSTKTVQEKLFLHTDKEFYVAGELLWFKVYYTDGSYHKPMALSKIVYTEILNEKNESVLQATIALEPGQGNGSFYLPTTLATGIYSIRAYTRWMKNFEEEYFFEKKFTIVNTLKNPESAKAGDTVGVSINFFPEGGNLVAGIQSRIGFEITNGRGTANTSHGYILDKSGDTVVAFSPLKFGIGSFDFTPETGNAYKAVIVFSDGRVVNKALPEIFNVGYVMRLTEINPDQIAIIIKSKKGLPQQSNEQILLVSHTRQVAGFAEVKSMNEGDSVVFMVDKKKIGKGITHFTVFNGNNKPVCERLYFMKPSSGVTLNVKTNQETYKNREGVNLSLNAQYISGKSSPLNLSASIFSFDTLQMAEGADIFSYMWLSSDLPGNIESPGYYFSDDPDVAKAADNLMLTHGWRRFKWNDVLQAQDNFVKYLPEINGQLIEGRVKDTRDQRPAQKINTYLSVAGHPFGFYTSQSDEQGNVSYEVKDFYGTRQVIAQPGMEMDSFFKVEIIKPYLETVSRRKFTPYILTENVRDQILQKSIDMQVQNIYFADSLRFFAEPIITDTLPFYGATVHSYRLDDYKRFTTMEEVLREYVMEIGVGIRRGKLNLKIFDPVAHEFFDSHSLVLLDGVALTDPDKIFSYDPLKVKKLEVIRDRYVSGKSFFKGIASFTTYEGVFDGFDLDPKLVAIDFNGLQLQREFYSPVYKTKEQIESKMPDLRNTLLWLPDITTDGEGKALIQLYTSDRKGKYIVVVQGMNENGDFVSAMKTFEVK